MKLFSHFWGLIGIVLLASCSSQPEAQEEIVQTCPDGRPYYDLYGEGMAAPELVSAIESTDRGLHYLVEDLDFWLPVDYSEVHVFHDEEGLMLSRAEDAHCVAYGDAFEPYIHPIDPEDSFAKVDGFLEVKTQEFPYFDATVYSEPSFGGTHLDTYEFKLGEQFYRSGAMQEDADFLKQVLSTLNSPL